MQNQQTIKYGREMQNSFSDTSDTDYDRAIADTRKRMERCEPCSNDRELLSLITRLEQMKQTYYTVPCLEGYCLGLFTPHRQRIDRRINAFKEEQKIHNADCKDYLAENSRLFDRETSLKIKELELQHDANIEKHRVDAQKSSVEETTIRKTGVFK